MPPEAVALAIPVMVPTPAVFANVTLVLSSPVTRLPAASRIWTVSMRVLPEIRGTFALVKATWSAVPATTTNVVEPELSNVADALIVIEPASAPVTVCEAIPPDAVALPRPVTVPAPSVFANATTVVLSPVSRLPATSRISTVSARDDPDTRFVVELVNVRRSAAPGTTLNVVEPELSDVADALIVIEPASVPVTFSYATPPEVVAVPRPLTLPVPLVFANVTLVVLSPVTTLPAAS